MTVSAFAAGAAMPVTTGVLLLAQQQDPGDRGGQGADFGKSSPVGLLLLLLFFVAVVFLVRSMSKHLKRVPATFDKDEQDGAGSAESGAESQAETRPVESGAAQAPVAADGQRREDRDQ